MTYRISLRSSSIWEPRHPLLKVFNSLFVLFVIPTRETTLRFFEFNITQHSHVIKSWLKKGIRRYRKKGLVSRDTKVGKGSQSYNKAIVTSSSFFCFINLWSCSKDRQTLRCGNDPSAGSPTETLLRLHLPLNDEV